MNELQKALKETGVKLPVRYEDGELIDAENNILRDKLGENEDVILDLWIKALVNLINQNGE